ncbi:Thioesterase/thiol ester dehydrase-isomerase [Lindgomyces ingoldianus]|uniref:Thioesterase/thiol ester dehydrase-isomerase n=1 Tax=Lindgomyces ingoldianus TaxID=673940 RepID=A0ACB6R0Q1_9PLEO|nr:Thioesterase/thiol ester dehydrase-isomerase [Lindgomyces ingoldianus]KAF2471907.1 Thioesterase/thiol ester dehydrase-isomerase [Lindgomyces ingoldianus]
MWATRSPGVARSTFCRYGIRKNFSPLRKGIIRGPLGRPFALRPRNWSERRLLGTSTTQDTSTSTSTPPNNSERTTQTPQQPQPPKRKPLWIRIPTFLALSAFFFGIGFTMTASPALPTAQALLSPPSDAETLTMFTPDNEQHQEIEKFIFTHPLTQRLTEDAKYIASRPHLKIPPNMRAQNLTGGTLLGEGKIAVPPLQFTTADGSEFASIQYLGPALCGYPGIIHGGLLATLLDEGLARCCFPALPNKVGVTASLKIDYRRPVLAEQYVVLRAETTKVEGRKAWVKGWLETLVEEGEDEKPVVLVEAEALFIEPRQAASMAKVYSAA